MAFNPEKCLKFRALENCFISADTSRIDGSHYQFRKVDKESWEIDAISLSQGEMCYVKGTNYPNQSTGGAGHFTISGGPAEIVSGNVMSLVDDGAGELTEITQQYGFYELFSNCANLKSIPSTLLPATTLANYCYESMFEGCTGLTSLPAGLLPATDLVSECYGYMFKDCTNLAEIPANLLSATTLARNCYAHMFEGSGLTSIPSDLLPAMTLQEQCYNAMFSKCNNLIEVPSNLLPATTLGKKCYINMFQACENLTVVNENFMHAENFLNNSCRTMFQSCPNLKEIHVSFTNWNDSLSVFTSWVEGVAPEGEFYCPDELLQEFDESHIPEGWLVNPVKTRQKGSITFFSRYSAPMN